MIARMSVSDAPRVARLAGELWESHEPGVLEAEYSRLLALSECAVFVLTERGEDAGFAQVQLRHDYVEGTQSSPVGYLEGIYVKKEHRRRGAAGKLLRECERWAKEKGCTEFASDCELSNTQSLEFHLGVGFSEANRIICFTKKL